MKLLLENWNKFLNEEKKGAYSFDYDETLIKYKTDPEDPEFSTIYDKPHEENIAKLRELAAAGETVYIVTSRSKRTREKYPWDTAPDPEELVADMNLPVKSIHYTNGDLKAETLLSLGVIEHWDDDEEEIAAAKEAGIKANFVPGDKEIRETMLSMWANKLQEAGIEPAPKMKKYLKDHPYMEPDGLQERCQKGYKTHPTRKTKKMYGKTYRNCVKAESEEPAEGETLEERAAIPMDEILRAEDIIRKHLEEMFDEIGRDDLTKNFSTEILVEPIVTKYINSRRANQKPRFDKLTGRMRRRSIKP